MIINSIFIIDDDPIVVFGIKKLLHQDKNQMQVLTFNNGEDAINAIYKLNQKQISLPEVIFLDLNMPIMDGWEFLDAFLSLKLDKKIQINILSSTIDPEDLNKVAIYKTVQHHSINFNGKPITRREIKKLTHAA